MKIKLKKKMIKWSATSLVSAGVVVSAVIVPLVVINSPDENNKKPDKMSDVIVTTIPFSSLTSSIYKKPDKMSDVIITTIPFSSLISSTYTYTIEELISKLPELDIGAGKNALASPYDASIDYNKVLIQSVIKSRNPEMSKIAGGLSFEGQLEVGKTNSLKVFYKGIDQNVILPLEVIDF